MREHRVLIVEDQPAIRSALTRYFMRRGWKADEVESGSDALVQLRGAGAGDYSLIISDVKMPGISGIELHSILSDEKPELLPRFVFSTGDSSADDVCELLSRTNCTVIHKPFELSLLDRMLKEIEQAGD